jgi:hypothetical protein
VRRQLEEPATVSAQGAGTALFRCVARLWRMTTVPDVVAGIGNRIMCAAKAGSSCAPLARQAETQGDADPTPQGLPHNTGKLAPCRAFFEELVMKARI